MTTQTEDQQQTTTKHPIEGILDLINARQYSRGWSAKCPAHNDHEASLMLWEDEKDGHVGIKCYAGCSRKAIVEAIGLTESDLYVPSERAYRPPRHDRKIDLLDLAIDKRIPLNVLVSLGITDGYTWHTSKGKIVKNVVRIPYYLADGQEYAKVRIRTTVTAKTGSKWEGPEVPLIPYGLNRLDLARKTGYVVIPEGESDCWTCWLHNVPALGVPGAKNEKTLHGDMLKSIERVYIIQEPDQEPGKDSFPKRVAQRLLNTGYQGQCYVVSLKRSHDVKDPNDLHQKLDAEGRVKAFKDELQKALDAATLVDIHTDTSNAEATFESLQPLVLDAIEKQDVNALYDLAEKIAALSPREKVDLTSSIKSGMSTCDTFSWSSFKKLMQEAEKAHNKRAHAERVYVTGKPEVLLGRQLHEEVDDALDALYKANHPPVIFIRGGKLVRCRLNETNKPLIEMMDEKSVIERLTRVAEFVTYNQETDSYSSVHPTAKIAHTILASPGWKFPPLEGITEVPIIRLDGTILDKPGYDSATRLLYIPQPGLVIPPIPFEPTPKQLHEARRYAFDFIKEFPYVGDADRANAFAGILTAVTRSLYDLAPMLIIDAPKQGTGKGLIAKVIALLNTGRSCASTTMPDTEEEWAKLLTGLLLEGSTDISIDNVEKVLNSAKLASFLTTDLWKQRVLGSNSTPELPQRCIVMANGNNIVLGGDIPRRCYRVRMDAQMSQPWKREGFTYNPLLLHVAQNRGRIIAALLTMTRAWYVAGCPVPTGKTPSIGEFDEWARVIGGILAHAGVNGFLSNNDALYEEADAEGVAWEAFLTAWLDLFKTREITVAELVKTLEGNKTFADTLPDGLSSAMLNPNKNFNRALSHALRKKKDTPFGPDNLKLSNGKPDSDTKGATWKVTGLAGLAGSDLPKRESKTFFSASDEKEEEKEKNKEEEKKVHNSQRGESNPANPANPVNSYNCLTPEQVIFYPVGVYEWHKKHGLEMKKHPCTKGHDVVFTPWYDPIMGNEHWEEFCDECHPEIAQSHGVELHF